MKHNLILKRIIANTQNIHLVPDSITTNVFNDLYKRLMNEGYGPFDAYSNDGGMKGYFAYTGSKANNDVTVYLFEIYSYVLRKKERSLKEKSTMLEKIESILIMHELDDKGNIINSDYDSYINEIWSNVESDLLSDNINLLNDYTILKAKDFQSAMNEIP